MIDDDDKAAVDALFERLSLDASLTLSMAQELRDSVIKNIGIATRRHGRQAVVDCPHVKELANTIRRAAEVLINLKLAVDITVPDA